MSSCSDRLTRSGNEIDDMLSERAGIMLVLASCEPWLKMRPLGVGVVGEEYGEDKGVRRPRDGTRFKGVGRVG